MGHKNVDLSSRGFIQQQRNGRQARRVYLLSSGHVCQWLCSCSSLLSGWHGGSNCWRRWHGSSFCKFAAYVGVVCRPLPESRFTLCLHMKHDLLRHSFASSLVSKGSHWIAAPCRRRRPIFAIDPMARRQTHTRQCTAILASGFMRHEAGVGALWTDVAAPRTCPHVTKQLRRACRHCWWWSADSLVAQYVGSFCPAFGLGCSLCQSFGSHGTAAEGGEQQTFESKSKKLESNGAKTPCNEEGKEDERGGGWVLRMPINQVILCRHSV